MVTAGPCYAVTATRADGRRIYLPCCERAEVERVVARLEEDGLTAEVQPIVKG
jgi:hypothetical protein